MGKLLLLAQRDIESEQAAGKIMAVIIVILAVAGIGFAIVAWQKSLKQRQKEAKRLAADLARRLQLVNERLPLLYEGLQSNPSDNAVHQQLWQIVEAFPHLSPSVYQASLDAVEAGKGQSTAKTFALAMGRYSCGHQRGDGLVTTYDEQSIRNDISARTDAM